MAYHHGNARAALLAAAAELLESEGAARLSLRGLAERAGLSRQAPYNHFADKEALLAELVRDGFDRLAAAMPCALGRSTDAAGAPVERLAAAADAYISFGQGEPALFRLMFGREFVDLARFAAAREAAAAARGQLSALVASVAASEAAITAQGPERVADVGLAAWSLVHGYTALCIESGLEEAGARPRRARQFAALIAAALR